MRECTNSVAGLLRRTFATLIALVLLSGAIAVGESQRHQAALDRLTEHTVPLRLNNLQLRSTMGDATRGLRNHMLYKAPKTLYDQARQQHAQYLQAMWRYADAPAERVAVGRHQELTRAWFAYAEKVDDTPPTDPRLRQYAENSRLGYERILGAIDALEGRLDRETDDLEDQVRREQFWSRLAVILVNLIVAVLAVFTSVRTYRALVGPLQKMARTVRRLAAGRRDERVVIEGPTEICALGTAINNMADEGGRLRRAEAERVRLMGTAHDAVVRIRETLDTEAVVREAAAALGSGLPADTVCIHLVQDGTIGPATVEWHNGALVSEPKQFEPVPAEVVHRLYRRRLTSYGHAQSPPASVNSVVAEGLRRLGDVNYLVVPFGSGDQALGALLLLRSARQGPWTASEIETVSTVGADLGRGLEHARLYNRERQLVEELRTLDAAKTDFMSTVSHELRSPLTSIAGYVELLRDEDGGAVNPAQDRMLDAIERNTTRLRILIEDLLTLSRIEAGAFRTVRQPVDLGEIAVAAADSVRPTAAKKEIDLRVSHPDGPVVVDGDVNQLDRAVVNLLSNAVKFTPEGGRVGLEVRVEDGHAAVAVSDSGIGIPAAEVQRMNERFFRASNATARSIPGTGLGLSIVRSIIANHSGTFALESVEDEGTTVTLRVPISERDDDAEQD
ncbi:HAMP domain-containing sensor histidine kinase [Actinomadura hibisca]|uniref:HAMP domain-containing sensor histidine kinase n=1 Tax=Actinomadura hibisca TaxID=68565 RepID=UPI000836546B|nr:ATP-binding protein [Actinomadura hibisca]